LVAARGFRDLRSKNGTSRHVRLPVPPLLLVTDRLQARLPLPQIISEACAAGCRWISMREKDLSEAEQTELFATLHPITRQWGARATIHGTLRSAQAAKADGVHLAAERDPGLARTLLGGEALIGVSVHQAAELAALTPDVVDYVIAGPAYETASKPGYGPALGATGIAAFVAASDVPVIAIGGITPDRAPQLLSAGAAGLAVMGTVMRSDEPGREIERLLAAVSR
jgi:thiamine-phosphate pyrophosphorylase